MKMKSCLGLVVCLGMAATLGSTSLQAINWAEANAKLNTAVKYESEFLFRGLKRGGPIIIPEASVGLYDFYAGAMLFQPVENSNDFNKLDLSLGYKSELISGLALDVGGLYHTYPDSSRSRSRELYVGAELAGLSDDGWLAKVYPKLYVMYDFDLQGGMTTVIGSFIYDWYLKNLIEDETFWLRFEPFVGWGDPDQARSWVYYGIRVDLNYAIAAGATASVGVRYSAKDRNDAFHGSDSDNFWWGAALKVGF